MAVLYGNLAPAQRGHQAVGGLAPPHAPHRPRRRLRLASKTSPPASMLPISTSHADDVLVLRNAGPKGAPGMPEAGYLPDPRQTRAPGRQATWCASPTPA